MFDVSELNENNVFEGELIALSQVTNKAKDINKKIEDTLYLKTISTELLKDKAVNKSIVETLFKYIPELQETIALESLTDMPTRIMLTEVERDVDKHLTDKLEVVKKEIQNYYDEDINRILSIINAFLNSNFSDFRYLIADLQKVSVEVLDLISKTKNTIIPVKGETTEFLDVITISSEEVKNLASADSDVIDIQKLLESFKTATTIVESNSIINYIFHSFAELEDVDLNVSIHDVYKHSDKHVTIQKLIKFFASDKTKIFINNIDKELIDIKSIIENELKDTNDISELSINNTITINVNRSMNVFIGLFNISRLFKTTNEIINIIRPLLT